MKKKIFNSLLSYLVFVVIVLFFLILGFMYSWIWWLYIIVLAIALFCIIKTWFNNHFVKRILALYNVHVFGYRRRGKDLLTQLVVFKRFGRKYKKTCKRLKLRGYTDTEIKEYFKKKPLYLSNVDYGYGALVIDINDLKLYDNNDGKVFKTTDRTTRSVIAKYREYKNDNERLISYEDIMNGAYKTMDIRKKLMYEGLDLILSDGQLSLPNTEHNELDKQFPWLPVFFALAGQLYNMNITVNSQEYSRLWIKLRGQQDAYIRALKTLPMHKSFFKKIWLNIPFLKRYIFIKIRYFEERQAAENNILPFKGSSISTEVSKNVYITAGQATKDQFEATNGKIKDKWIVINLKHIKYDTRIFHEYMFGYKFEESPKLTRKQRRLARETDSDLPIL